MESWFLDGKTPNSDEMVLLKPLHRHTIVRAKFGERTLFPQNPVKMRLLGYFGM